MKKVNLAYLNETIENFKKSGQKPSKLLLGYKVYAELMRDTKFSDEILNSALDANKRKYKKLKIKITQDEYQLSIE